METKEPLLKSIFLKNLLSFGPEGTRLDLHNLNVLIGPNGSGKSNLIAAFGLLNSLGSSSPQSIWQLKEWLWRGGGKEENPQAQIEVILEYPQGQSPLRYSLELTGEDKFEVLDERLESTELVYYWHENGVKMVNGVDNGGVASLELHEASRLPYGNEELPMRRRKERLRGQWSDPFALSQRWGEEFYPELNYLSDIFSKFNFYFGHSGWDRDLENRLNDGGLRERIMPKLNKRFHEFYAPAIEVAYQDGKNTFKEQGLQKPLPLSSLSDGTKRYLYLVSILEAVLDDQIPPPLICIEEPELGLHPDVNLHLLADLLMEASARTQLIVTTHSVELLDALSGQPEAVVVCEKGPANQTEFKRLSTERLAVWLEEYSLGKIWASGEIGGNRW